MKLKKLLKKKLGNQYYKFRLKFILSKILGKYYDSIRNFFKARTNKFNFIKKNLNKKIEHQSIIKKELGFIVDFTKDNYFSYHLRPKSSKNFYLESTCSIDEKLAIIIQGPIQNNFNFLKNTIEIYKKIFKNSLIVISTWERENQILIDSLKDENIFILYNKEPEKSYRNIDHQICSTNVALNFALEKGAKYSLKTRTDVRLYKNNLETFLISLIKSFPVKQNKLTKSRIIVPSLVTFKFRLYSLSDIVMFGETEDLLKYFNVETYKEGLEKFNLNEQNVIKEGTPIVAEIFLCSRFINALEGKINWNLNNWWQSLKDYFCIVDNSSLDLFWYKYDWEYENRYLRTYSDKFARAIDFQDWLSLYQGLENNWLTASSESEKYNELGELTNIFKD